jgi:hypothetical protein
MENSAQDLLPQTVFSFSVSGVRSVASARRPYRWVDRAVPGAIDQLKSR